MLIIEVTYKFYSMQSLIKLLSQKITCINFILGEGGLEKNILRVKNKKNVGMGVAGPKGPLGKEPQSGDLSIY